MEGNMSRTARIVRMKANPEEQECRLNILEGEEAAVVSVELLSGALDVGVHASGKVVQKLPMRSKSGMYGGYFFRPSTFSATLPEA